MVLAVLSGRHNRRHGICTLDDVSEFCEHQNTVHFLYDYLGVDAHSVLVHLTLYLRREVLHRSKRPRENSGDASQKSPTRHHKRVPFDHHDRDQHILVLLENAFVTIAVLGAEGRSGKVFVMYALKQGHTIRAGSLTQTYPITHERLSIFHCDVTNASEVLLLVEGADAIVSLVGHTKNSSPSIQTDMVRILSEHTKSLPTKRFISLTGTGVREPSDHISLLDRIVIPLVRLFDTDRLQDGINHVKLLKSSSLDWTVIRVSKLQDTGSTPYQLTPHGPARAYVTRTAVAEAILEILDQHLFVCELPVMSHP